MERPIMSFNSIKMDLSNKTNFKLLHCRIRPDTWEFVIKLNIDSFVNKVYFPINQTIKILVPKNFPTELCVVKSVGAKLNGQFPHLNSDGSFCLGTEMDIRLLIGPDYCVLHYIDLIGTFLGNYLYFERFGTLPFAERSHYTLGVMETYRDLFKVTNYRTLKKLMAVNKASAKQKNLPCPCGSGIKFKNCHWAIINRLTATTLKRKQLEKDFQTIF